MSIIGRSSKWNWEEVIVNLGSLAVLSLERGEEFGLLVGLSVPIGCLLSRVVEALKPEKTAGVFWEISHGSSVASFEIALSSTLLFLSYTRVGMQGQDET